MNADVRAIKTAAEQGLSAAYTAARAALPGNGAVAALRDDAFAQFEKNGLPHRRVEQWKYTDLRALMREAKPLAPAVHLGPAEVKRLTDILPGVDAARIVIVNGRYVPALSDTASLGAGVVVEDLFANLASAPDGSAAMPGSDDAALGLNTVFMTGGVALRVKAGTKVTKPIHIAHVFSGDATASMYPRSLVTIEANAKATLIESYSGPDRIDYQINAVLELTVADGATVDHIKLGFDGDAALRIATLGVTVGAKAVYRNFAFTIGGAVVRNQTFARFAGEGTHGALSGASLLKGRQHADNTLVIEHAAAHCESREQFRSVLDGQSHAVFQGKIVVNPHAQKTDAKMLTRALLLSDEAEADNKPELEIFADDVVCGHGATAGALDPGLKFYLMSRGISEKEAEALLIHAFVGDAIEGVTDAAIRDVLMNACITWVGART